MSNEDKCWGDIWLPVILKAVTGTEIGARGVRLHFEYGMYATAALIYDDDSESVRTLSLFGTNSISEVLNAPRYLQAITLDVEENKFVIANCRYAPMDANLDEVLATLAMPQARLA